MRQLTFLGHIMKKIGLENLILIIKFDGKKD